MQEPSLGMMQGGGGGYGGDGGGENRQLKAEIATHPLYEQLLSAHVACLRVATPIDQLPLIDAQLSQSHHLLRSYISQQTHSLSPHDRQQLDNFLVCHTPYSYFYKRHTNQQKLLYLILEHHVLLMHMSTFFFIRDESTKVDVFDLIWVKFC